ncbi:DUF6255 family natural product biosynthesis protein [Streptomyces sp. KLMMK]|uniref:DUF6255 family natural product biosynthesis protein n=1 Tax=Streptomyces sp. KLMMK TaxID=3109353 RepID=UPI003FA6B5DF
MPGPYRGGRGAERRVRAAPAAGALVTALSPERAARDVAAATRTAAGRLVFRRCAHPVGWSRTLGFERCPLCGAERHTAYAALRMPMPDSAPAPVWGCPSPGAPGRRPPGSAYAKTPPSVR